MQTLEIVGVVDSAFDAKVREDGHQLSNGKPCKFGRFAKGSLSFFVSLDGQQEPAARNEVTHSFGEVAALFLGEFGEKFVVLAIHADTHCLGHSCTSNFNLASSMIDSL